MGKLSDKVPADYHERLHLALMAFKHQRVFDLDTEMIVPLNDFDRELTVQEESYIGG